MSVKRDRNGRWRYRKRITLPDGKRVRVSGTPTTNTKAAAEAAERAHIHRMENPSAVVAPAKEVPTVREYSEVFMEAHAAADKPSSVASKRQILNAYILPVLGESRLDAVLQVDVDLLVASLIRGRERKTVNNILAVLSSLLRYAAKNGRRPPVDLDFYIKGDETELVALSPPEIDALLAAAADARYHAAILLACDAGLRVGEIRAFRWGDVNELRRALTVARSVDRAWNITATKNRKRRTVPITPRLWDALRQVEQRGEVVVAKRDGGMLSYFTMLEKLHAIYVTAEVEPPQMPWHCMRHTFCTELANRGAPVHVIRDLAGHESIQTTLRYIHTTEGAKRDAIALLSGPKGQSMGKTETSKTGKPR